METGFARSLGRLHCAGIYGLLIHGPSDLKAAQGPSIWDAFQRLKSQGLVAKIGVSVYDPEQLEQIVDRCEVVLRSLFSLWVTSLSFLSLGSVHGEIAVLPLHLYSQFLLI